MKTLIEFLISCLPFVAVLAFYILVFSVLP